MPRAPRWRTAIAAALLSGCLFNLDRDLSPGEITGLLLAEVAEGASQTWVPAAGAQVQVVGSASAPIAADTAGRFHLSLSPGTYTLAMTWPGTPPVTAFLQTSPIVLAPGNGVDLGTIRLNAAGAIHGHVYLAGALLPDATLQVLQDNGLPLAGIPSAESDTSGSYAIPYLPAGSQRVQASYHAADAVLTAVSNPVTVVPRTDTEVDLYLTPPSQPGCETAPTANLAMHVGGSPLVGSVQPLTTVQLDGSGSPGSSGAAITRYVWTLLSQPANGTTMIDGSGSSVSLLCELDGTYTVSLVVVDANGCESTPVSGTIIVVPGAAGIHVELTWAEPYGDLDLHYVGPGGTFFDPPRTMGGMGGDLDFYYAGADCTCSDDLTGAPCGVTCTRNAGAPLIDWGLNDTIQPDGTHTDDPALDADQAWGNGPENVTHPEAFDATYTVMVHYYCSSAYDLGGCNAGSCTDFGAATATIRIWANGQANPIWSGSQSLTAAQVWTAATIQVSNNGANVVATTSDVPVYQSGYGCEDGIALSPDAGTGPCTVLVAPSFVQFGPVEIGTIATQPVILQNTGTETCDLSNLAISPNDSADEFGLVGPPASLMLSGGQSAMISLAFSPSDGTAPLARSGTFTATMMSGSTTASGQLQVQLSGTVVVPDGGT